MAKFWSIIRQILEYKLTLGNVNISLISALELILIVVIFLVLSRAIRKFLQQRIFPRFKLPSSSQFIMLRVVHYILVVIGLMLALSAVGIKITTLTMLFGIIGVGIAFGLQNITSNFVSGIILLFERPIGVGDYIEVGDVIGQVKAINMRSTTIITGSNITLIVPNSKFIEGTVTNWSIGDLKIRIIISIRVAYGSDTKLVEKLLLKVAAEHPQILSEPEPGVLFMDFGDFAFNFALRVWIPDPTSRLKVTSDLNHTIDAVFKENSIKVPFPQRDVHMYNDE